MNIVVCQLVGFVLQHSLQPKCALVECIATPDNSMFCDLSAGLDMVSKVLVACKELHVARDDFRVVCSFQRLTPAQVTGALRQLMPLCRTKRPGIL